MVALTPSAWVGGSWSAATCAARIEAKALGITVPLSLLATAGEVIE